MTDDTPYWRDWREHKPRSAVSADESGTFTLVKGQRWEKDNLHQERHEIAGPAGKDGFRIEVEYVLPGDLPIADPKLTIFQIHSSYLRRECGSEPCTQKPLFMFNLRPFSRVQIGAALPLTHPDVYWAGIFNTPDHDKSMEQEWKPDFGLGHVDKWRNQRRAETISMNPR